MSVTKKAKTVKVKFVKVPSTRTEVHYECPSCYVNFQLLGGWSASVEITRFRCSNCGQELIVSEAK